MDIITQIQNLMFSLHAKKKMPLKSRKYSTVNGNGFIHGNGQSLL